MRALGEMALDMIVEIAADGIRKNQRVVYVLRYILIDHSFATIPESGQQHMGAFVISDGFQDMGLNTIHGC